jgi:hypothetical protein
MHSVIHADLPFIEFTNIDPYVVALPWPVTPFRDSGYFVADCIHVSKLFGEFGGARCEIDCVIFPDGLLTGKGY